jgi:serine/threonine-protein kinase RsbW
VNLDVALCLPREAESVALVRAAITNMLLLFGVDNDCVEDIRLAVSEACANVVRHAADSDEYEIRVELDDERCTISVSNAGPGFDSASLTGVMADDSSPQGRGVAIMHAVMDETVLTSEPKAGTLVRLVKSLAVNPDGPMARLRRRAEPGD